MGPFRWVSNRSHRSLFAVLTASALALSLALAAIGQPLRTEEAPLGILSYEFARSGEHAARILGSWSPTAREHAMLSLGLDYLYLVVYPAWFSLACVLIGRRHPAWARRLGGFVAWAVLAAGVFDAVENYALVQMLTLGPSDGWARMARSCAGPKFALVTIAAAYALAGSGALLWRWRPDRTESL